MTHIFQNPCSHCGVCCLLQRCPVVIGLKGGQRNVRCEELLFDGTTSSCGLIVKGLATPQEIGSGLGCCISAQVHINGQMEYFAALPEEVKTQAANHLRLNQATVVHRRDENGVLKS